MGKIKAVWELFDEASRKVSRNGKEWADYLKFASRIYKYNFDNALQITDRIGTQLCLLKEKYGKIVSAEQ